MIWNDDLMPIDNHPENKKPFQGEVADLRREVNELTAELAGVYDSKIWRMMEPVRWGALQLYRTFKLLRHLFFLMRTGSFFPLLNKFMRSLFQKGFSGVRAQVVEHLQKHARSQEAESDEAAFAGQRGNFLERAKERRPTRPGILFVSHEASRTGAPIFLLDLIQFLSDKLDLEFYILFCRGGELVSAFQPFGSVTVLPSYGRIPPQIMQIIKRSNIKLIYSNTISNGAVQSQLKRLGCPILCHVHELAFSIENYFGEDNLARVKDTTTWYLAGSKAVMDYLVHKIQVPFEKVLLAYPFVKPVSEFQVGEMPAPLEFEPGTIVVGACGTISWRKGPDLFLQVANLTLRQVNVPVVFVWVGGPLDGDYIQLRYDVEQMGIDRNVIFTGRVQNHLRYFSQFDVFVLPSREDPFPLVMLDAASMGVPIVCFDKAGGAPEIVEADAGIITPYMDVESMSDAIVTLIKDTDLRKKMGERAREKAAGYDISTGGMKILDIIKKTLVVDLEERTK